MWTASHINYLVFKSKTENICADFIIILLKVQLKLRGWKEHVNAVIIC